MCLAGLFEATWEKMLSCETWGGSWQRRGVRAIKTYGGGQEITFYIWQDPSNAFRLPAGKELTDLSVQPICS